MWPLSTPLFYLCLKIKTEKAAKMQWSGRKAGEGEHLFLDELKLLRREITNFP